MKYKDKNNHTIFVSDLQNKINSYKTIEKDFDIFKSKYELRHELSDELILDIYPVIYTTKNRNQDEIKFLKSIIMLIDENIENIENENFNPKEYFKFINTDMHNQILIFKTNNNLEISSFVRFPLSSWKSPLN